MLTRFDPHAPADTPTGRREQLAHELEASAGARRALQLPRAPSPVVNGLARPDRRLAQQRALARIARAHSAEYLAALAEETARIREGTAVRNA